MPVVLHSQFYAAAALAGGAVVAIGHGFVPLATTLLPGTAICVLLRLAALYRDFVLPLPRRPDGQSSDR
jgi:uncharacterized membrane protein YeiH